MNSKICALSPVPLRLLIFLYKCLILLLLCKYMCISLGLSYVILILIVNIM